MASSVKTLLYTNAIPSDTQCADIRDFLAASTPQLEALEAEVSRLQELLASATKQRDLQKELIEAHRALLSPVRRLPEDILRAVFVATLPVDRDTAMCADEGPLLLAQICKFWRDVSLTAPRLWSSVHVVIPDPEYNHLQVEQLLVALSTWLQRSGAVPLSLTIAVSRDNARTFTSSSTDSVLGLLASVASRWQSFRVLAIFNFSEIPYFSSLTAEDVPLLQRIELTEVQSSQTTRSGNIAVLGTLKLRSLTFYGRVDILLPYIASWPSLQRCILQLPSQNPHPTVFPLEILEKCPRLEYLDIYTSALDMSLPGPETSHTILLPNLKSLQVAGLSSLGWRQLIERVSFPMLDSIGILLAVADLVWLIPSGHRLTVLHFYAGAIVADTLAHVLAAMPSLQVLSLTDEPLVNDETYVRDDGFLQRFHPVGGNALCPRLERFRLRNIHSASDTTIVNFIRSRTTNPGHAGVASFTHVVLTISRPPQEPNIRAQLAPQIAGGLVLDVRHPGYTDDYAEPQYSPRNGISQPNDLYDAFAF